MLTQAALKERVTYDPQTGLFSWKDPRTNCVKAGDQCGRPDRHGYIRMTINDRLYGAHRLAWLYVHGEWPTQFIDHINNDKSDNRLENLREASRSQNNQNTPKRKNNTSGVKGVCFEKKHNRWLAQIMVNGKIKKIGRFKTIEAASEAYAKVAAVAHGEFLNHSVAALLGR